MSKLRAPEPGTFEHLLRLVPATIADMRRLSISGKTEPFWSKRARYRFDDPSSVPAASRFGVLYVAPKVSTTFAESVIHEDTMFHSGRFEVPLTDIDSRQLTTYTHDTKTQLQLADLTGVAAKRMALSNDISAGDDYELPQRWAKAIHDALPDADGLLYMSRQNPGEVCYAVFDRSGLKAASWRKLSDAEKLALCDEFNVEPV